MPRCRRRWYAKKCGITPSVAARCPGAFDAAKETRHDGDRRKRCAGGRAGRTCSGSDGARRPPAPVAAAMKPAAFEREIALPAHPYEAAMVYLAVMAYPEAGAGKEGNNGSKFATALASAAIWSCAKARGLRYVREQRNDPNFVAPKKRDFKGAFDRGMRRIHRRSAAYDLVGTQLVRGFFAATALGVQALREGRADDAYHMHPSGGPSPRPLRQPPQRHIALATNSRPRRRSVEHSRGGVACRYRREPRHHALAAHKARARTCANEPAIVPARPTTWSESRPDPSSPFFISNADPSRHAASVRWRNDISSQSGAIAAATLVVFAKPVNVRRCASLRMARRFPLTCSKNKPRVTSSSSVAPACRCRPVSTASGP